MNSQTEKLPTVYDYASPLRFLRDTLSHYKSQDANFSVRKWALQMELKSPKPLIKILNGVREVLPEHFTFLVKGLKVDDNERLFFLSLIYRANAYGPDDEKLFNSMLETLSPGEHKTVAAVTQQSFFSHWSYATLITMAQLKDFDFDMDKIQSTLNYPVDTQILSSTLNEIEKIGYLKKDESGRLRKSHNSILTPADMPHAGGREYVKQASHLAMKAIDLPPAEREFHSFTICVDEADLPKLKDVLRGCHNSLSRLASGPGDRVYQVNLQLFPMTRSTRSLETKDLDF